jgi:hypothetical protein
MFHTGYRAWRVPSSGIQNHVVRWKSANISVKLAAMPASYQYLAWLTLWFWRWRGYVPPKLLLLFHQTTLQYIPEDRILHTHHCENLESNRVYTISCQVKILCDINCFWENVLFFIFVSCQILAELIQAGGEILWSEIKLINSIWNKEELPDQWKESTILQIHKKGNKTVCSNYHGISLLSTSYKILSNFFSQG